MMPLNESLNLLAIWAENFIASETFVSVCVVVVPPVVISRVSFFLLPLGSSTISKR